MASPMNFTKHLRNKTILHKLFWNMEKEKVFPNSFYEASITPYQNQTKTIQENYKPISFVNAYVKSCKQGTSLVVQWLGLRAFTARARVQSLIGELRSHKPRSPAKKKSCKRNFDKSIPVIYKKDNTSCTSRVHPRNARLV